MIVKKKNSLKGRVSVKLNNLMIRLTHKECVNLGYKENEIKD